MEWWKAKIRNKAGQSLVELLVALGLAAILIPAIFSGVMAMREGRVQTNERQNATLLVRKLFESVRVVRDSGWTSFAINGTYHPVIVNGNWVLATGPITDADGVTQSVTIDSVYREGVEDHSTKKIILLVSWSKPVLGQLSEEIYLTRFKDNLTFNQSTRIEFDAGVTTGTTVTNTAGGEIILGSGGSGDWCDPKLNITPLNLPKSGVAHALYTVEGKAFAVTGDNASGVAFAQVNITDTNPPNSSLAGTFDGFKTNGVFGETDYAYISTDNNAKEIVIINNFSEVGYFNSPGSDNGVGIAVSGNVGFMTSGNKLYSFDLSAKTGSRSSLGDITLSGVGQKLFVVGQYVYAVSSTLQIIDVQNPSVMSIVGSFNSGTTGIDVFVNQTGTRGYYASGSNVYILDVTNKTSVSQVGTYSTSGMTVKGLVIVSGNKMIVVGTGGDKQYQVVDIANESQPIVCGSLATASGINAITSILEQDGDAYSYILTQDASSEFQIIEGGPGGKLNLLGTFESASFDPGYSTSYNYVSFNSVIPVNTTLTAQVAVSADCNSFNYVGPDGTSDAFYSSSGGAVPIGLSSGRCFRYKLFFDTTDTTATPIFYDFTVNYSP